MCNEGQLIRRNDEDKELSSKKTSAADAVKSVRQGLKDIEGGKQPEDIEVLATAKFQKPGTLIMNVGASPDIKLNGKSKDEEVSQTVTYTARMAIMDASFYNLGSTLCLNEVSFTSKVTPGAHLKLTFPLVDYCQFGLEDTKNKCIQFETKDKLDVILNRFNECNKIDSTDSEKIANCFCKAFIVKKNKSGSDGTSSISGDKDTSSASKASSTDQTTSGKPATTGSASNTLTGPSQTSNGLANTPNFLYLFLVLLCLYTFRYKH